MINGIDEKKTFQPLNIAVLTVSDTRTEQNDRSGDLLADRIQNAGHRLASRLIVTDDVQGIQNAVRGWISSGKVDVIISTGGTGLTGRDVTVEAMLPLIDKQIDGFSVIFHLISYGSVGLSTLQSRAMAGISNGVVIFCLPGSTGAVKDGWDKVIEQELDARYMPCNLVDLIPRFKEK